MAIDWKVAYENHETVLALCEMAIDQFWDMLGGMDGESAKIAAMKEMTDGVLAYPDMIDMENAAQRKAYPFAEGERGDTGMVDGEDLPF